MQFQYVLQYRDAAEAVAHRFPGDPAPAPVPGRVHLAGLGVAIIGAAAIYLLGSGGGGAAACASLRVTLAQLDRVDHPVFVAGLLLCAVGAALVLVPAAYLLARRRSARPMFEEAPTHVSLDDTGVTLRTTLTELRVRWDGVLAVAETRSLLVLKTAGDLRLLIPKRAAPSSAALDDLRAALRHYVPLMTLVAAEVQPNRPMGMAA